MSEHVIVIYKNIHTHVCVCEQCARVHTYNSTHVNIFRRVIIVHDWRDERGVTGYNNNNNNHHHIRSEIVFDDVLERSLFFSNVFFFFFLLSEKTTLAFVFPPCVHVCAMLIVLVRQSLHTVRTVFSSDNTRNVRHSNDTYTI